MHDVIFLVKANFMYCQLWGLPDPLCDRELLFFYFFGTTFSEKCLYYLIAKILRFDKAEFSKQKYWCPNWRISHNLHMCATSMKGVRKKLSWHFARRYVARLLFVRSLVQIQPAPIRLQQYQPFISSPKSRQMDQNLTVMIVLKEFRTKKKRVKRI